MKKAILFSGAILVILGQAFSQEPSRKVALVIGVKSYESVPPLKNSVNDAMAMASVLKTKGFVVTELYDPHTKRELQEVIRKHFSLIQGQTNTAGLIFYSGHGMQVDGTNYLIPTKANPQIKADLDEDCLKMDYVMAAIDEAGNPLNIFILDACRNNPFRSFSRSSQQGLNQVSAPRGSYIVYATAANSVASDGTGNNGLFTSKLLKYMNSPGLNIEEVFKYVARDVSNESQGSQIPWLSQSYFGDFYFSGQGNSALTKSVVSPKSINTKTQELSNNSYAEAVDLYSKQSYADAGMKFRLLADKGDANSQFYLAKMYLYGHGFAKDYNEAMLWSMKSAELGNSNAQVMLGGMYRNGTGLTKNYDEARKWFTKSAEQENPKGCYSLALLLEGGYGVEKSTTEAEKWYSKAAELFSQEKWRDDPDDQNYLGLMYQYGRGFTKDYNLAFDWFQKSANGGNANAQTSVGYFYDKGLSVSQSDKDALYWYRKAAEQGQARAQSNLGSLYENGKGVDQDYNEALNWYRKSAEQKDSNGEVNVGRLYESGKGVNQDYNEAIIWYRKSADQGNSYGENNLGRMYALGYGVTKDGVEAIKWYRKSADHNNHYAQYNLGWMYEYGNGVTTDIEEAVKWYKKASDNGNEDAKNALIRLGR